MLKKFIIISILLLIPLSASLAYQQTELTYPTFLNLQGPVTTRSFLSEYIRYIFYAIVGVSGFVCFGSLVYAGALYVTSVGNPNLQKEAKDRIFSSFIGMVIVLSSYLLLNTINPQLINVQVGVESLGGVVLYTTDTCDDANGEPRSFTVSSRNFGLTKDGQPYVARALKFLSKKEELDVELFDEEDFKGSSLKLTSNESCVPNIGNKKSIKFFWQLPGVYLCDQPLNDQGRCDGNELYLSFDAAAIDPRLNDKVRGIRFVADQGGRKYGAVVHEHKDMQGTCARVTENVKDTSNIELPTGAGSIDMSNKISSVTVYVQTNRASGRIRLCRKDDYKDCAPDYTDNYRNMRTIGLDDEVESVFIDGNRMILLFADTNFKGKCAVLRKSDPDLTDNSIGRCGCKFGFFCHSCVSSFMMFPIAE